MGPIAVWRCFFLPFGYKDNLSDWCSLRVKLDELHPILGNFVLGDLNMFCSYRANYTGKEHAQIKQAENLGLILSLGPYCCYWFYCRSTQIVGTSSCKSSSVPSKQLSSLHHFTQQMLWVPPIPSVLEAAAGTQNRQKHLVGGCDTVLSWTDTQLGPGWSCTSHCLSVTQFLHL